MAVEKSRVLGRGSGDEEHSSVRVLLQRKIVRDFAVGLQTVLFDYSDDANDGDGLFRIEPEMFSDGVIVRPEALREILVDDGDLRHVDAVVLLGEEAARDQRNLHGAEIVVLAVR